MQNIKNFIKKNIHNTYINLTLLVKFIYVLIITINLYIIIIDTFIFIKIFKVIYI